MKIKLLLLLLFLCTLSFSQNGIGIGTSSPLPSAILDITSINKGLLIPRMTYSQKIGIGSPAQGLLVYQTNSGGFPVQSSGLYHYDGTAWKRFARSDEITGGSGGTGWTITGDDQYSNLAGNVGIGITAPTSKLHVVGNILQENGTFTINHSGGIIQFKNANVNKTYVQLSGNNLRMGTNSGNTGGEFIIRMDGMERMVIDSTGNVGIGTINPESKLHVVGGNIKVERNGVNGIGNPYSALVNFEMTNDNNKSGGLLFTNNGSTIANAYYVHKNAYPSFFRFGISDPEAFDLMIADNARVGINIPGSTTDLVGQLHIRGANNVDELALSNAAFGGTPTIQFYSTLVGGITKSTFVQMTDNNLRMGTNSGNSSGKFIIRMNSTDQVAVSPNGNMGIGTLSPAARLHIDGGVDVDPNPFAGNGFLMLGDPTGVNVAMDDNEIMARNGAGIATLVLQNDGGNLKVGSNNRLLVDNNGNVGINTGSPGARLDVNGSVKLGYTTINAGGSGQVLQLDGNVPALGFTSGSLYSFLQMSASKFQLGIGNSIPLQLDANQVAIGRINNNANSFKLTVDGKIICEELKVEVYDSWPDYVFRDDYELKPLNELKSFIKMNSHLPNIPKATEVAKEGFEVGEMNRKLLEKVEELTLYVIQLQDQIDALKKQGKE